MFANTARWRIGPPVKTVETSRVSFLPYNQGELSVHVRHGHHALWTVRDDIKHLYLLQQRWTSIPPATKLNIYSVSKDVNHLHRRRRHKTSHPPASSTTTIHFMLIGDDVKHRSDVRMHLLRSASYSSETSLLITHMRKCTCHVSHHACSRRD